MAKKRPTRARAAPRRRAGKRAAKATAAAAAATKRAQKKFSRDAYLRGEAKSLKEGKLEPGATFELHGFDEDGTPVITRRRFTVS